MRLSDYQVKAIKTVINTMFDDDAEIKLFGSRTDDDAKGGDIDLLIKTPNPVEQPARLIAQIEAQIIRQIGDQKIDIVLDAPNLERKTIHHIADQTGIQF